jgi:hypothetical protein
LQLPLLSPPQLPLPLLLLLPKLLSLLLLLLFPLPFGPHPLALQPKQLAQSSQLTQQLLRRHPHQLRLLPP